MTETDAEKCTRWLETRCLDLAKERTDLLKDNALLAEQVDAARGVVGIVTQERDTARAAAELLGEAHRGALAERDAAVGALSEARADVAELRERVPVIFRSHQEAVDEYEAQRDEARRLAKEYYADVARDPRQTAYAVTLRERYPWLEEQS